MNHKKKIPLTVLKGIEPYVGKSGEHFISIEPEKDLIRLKDSDDDSDFHFYIKSYQIKGQYQLSIQYKPQSELKTDQTTKWINGQDLGRYFEQWLKFLEGYENVKSPYDDPIVEGFKNEYYDEFEFIIDDENEPLKSKQILFFDNYLETTSQKLLNYKTEENNEQIEAIVSDIKELRNGLTTQTRKWIVTKFCWIWGKISKLGVNFIKDFQSEAKKMTIKEGLKKIFEIGSEIIT